MTAIFFAILIFGGTTLAMPSGCLGRVAKGGQEEFTFQFFENLNVFPHRRKAITRAMGKDRVEALAAFSMDAALIGAVVERIYRTRDEWEQPLYDTKSVTLSRREIQTRFDQRFQRLAEGVGLEQLAIDARWFLQTETEGVTRFYSARRIPLPTPEKLERDLLKGLQLAVVKHMQDQTKVERKPNVTPNELERIAELDKEGADILASGQSVYTLLHIPFEKKRGCHFCAARAADLVYRKDGVLYIEEHKLLGLAPKPELKLRDAIEQLEVTHAYAKMKFPSTEIRLNIHTNQIPESDELRPYSIKNHVVYANYAVRWIDRTMVTVSTDPQ